MKIYLAGPMRGIKNFNIEAFAAAAIRLRLEGHEVFSPAEKGCEVEVMENPSLANSLEFRRRVFSLDTDYICNHAEAVAMLPGWRLSKGAQAEHALADAIGIKIMYLGEEYSHDAE